MLLAHHFTIPQEVHSHDIVDLLDSTFYERREGKGEVEKEEDDDDDYKAATTSVSAAYPSHIPPALDLSYCSPESDAYLIDSRKSTPYDNTLHTLPGSQLYMTNAFSPNPRLRVLQSTPNNGVPSAVTPVTPPPMNDGSNWVQPSWNNFSSDQAYLSPQTEQYTNQQTFRSHKRLSSGSSVGSTGPDSPYTQTQAYPHIVDLDTGSAASPQLDPYDTSYHQAQQYGKPLYAQSNPLHSPSIFNPAFQNLNISGNDAGSMIAGQHATRQVIGSQNASNMNTGQCNPRRSFGGMDGSMGIQTNIPKLDRTVSDVYQDELYDSSMASSATQTSQSQQHHQHRRNVSQAQLLSPSYRSVFNDRLQQANTARSVSPSTNVSRERSPFRDNSEFAGQSLPQEPSAVAAATRIHSAAQMREQQKMQADADVYAQHHPSHHDFEIAPKTISPKEALLDEIQDDAKMPILPQIKRESDFSSADAAHAQFVRGKTNTTLELQKKKKNNKKKNSNTNNTNSDNPGLDDNDAQSYTSMSSHRRHTPNLASARQPFSSYTFMPPSVPTSGAPQQYPFISQSRRQSSSMRSGQSDQVPDFPASLTSMESTKSDSGMEQNIRPPAFTSQETTSSQRSEGVSPMRRPSDTLANSGSYTCTATGCSARFHTSSKLQRHRRENHRASPRHGSMPDTPSSSTPHPHNPQAVTNNISRNNAPGPHKCERINPSTGKPCNTVFSRSYDLTRHEDTIHNNRKTKVRCHLCTEEKTFSRNDALTRHMRVVHPDVDFPGRNRRRGGG
ncbi:MAG: hypothetical protein Q9217_005529 [Psora testacea]